LFLLVGCGFWCFGGGYKKGKKGKKGKRVKNIKLFIVLLYNSSKKNEF